MIYGQISLLVVLLAIAGALAVLFVRTMNRWDVITLDMQAFRLDLAATKQQAETALAKIQGMETEHYSKLAARVAVHAGELETASERLKALGASTEQLNLKFASWARTEGKARKSGERAAEATAAADQENMTLQEALPFAAVEPLPPSNIVPMRGPGKSIRTKVA